MHKRDEGLWARVPAAIVGGIVTVYMTKAAIDSSRNPAVSYIMAGIAFAVLGIFTLYLCFFNRKVGDILVDTENEMRKVVWPNRDEVSGSTIVVIGTTVLLSLAIFVVDIALTWGLQLINLYPKAS